MGGIIGLMLFFYDEYWVFHKNTSGKFYEWIIQDMKKQMYRTNICFNTFHRKIYTLTSKCELRRFKISAIIILSENNKFLLTKQ